MKPTSTSCILAETPRIVSESRHALAVRASLVPLLIATLWPAAAGLHAQAQKPGEYDVKAVYLYNFGRFVEWPVSAVKNDSFTICVLGEDPFGAVLDRTIAGETIDNQKLVSRRIASARDSLNCRILFISQSETGHVKEIIATVENSGVLTVSDITGFTGNGGIIQFVLKENKVRFEVNLRAAEKAGLVLSSQLLKVATEVKKDSSGQEAPR